MPAMLSAVEVLSRLVERVRRIESQAGEVAAVMDRMIESLQRQRSAGSGPEPERRGRA